MNGFIFFCRTPRARTSRILLAWPISFCRIARARREKLAFRMWINTWTIWLRRIRASERSAKVTIFYVLSQGIAHRFPITFMHWECRNILSFLRPVQITNPCAVCTDERGRAEVAATNHSQGPEAQHGRGIDYEGLPWRRRGVIWRLQQSFNGMVWTMVRFTTNRLVIDRLIDWLMNVLIHAALDWLIDWSIDWLMNVLLYAALHRLIDWVIDWCCFPLIDRFISVRSALAWTIRKFGWVKSRFRSSPLSGLCSATIGSQINCESYWKSRVLSWRRLNTTESGSKSTSKATSSNISPAVATTSPAYVHHFFHSFSWSKWIFVSWEVFS